MRRILRTRLSKGMISKCNFPNTTLMNGHCNQMIQQVSDHDLMMMKMMPFPHGLSFREAEEDGFCQEPSRGL